MSRRFLIPACCLVAGLLCAQTPPKPTVTDAPGKSVAKKKSAAGKSAKRSKKKAAKPEPQQVAVTPPPPPPTLAEQSPVAPRVSYQGGLLTIDAPNSTLGDILGSVKKLTNASLDGPQNLSDRVAVRIGPGQPRDVLSTLLHGSRFNFVLMGTPEQPNGISKIVLLPRSGTAEPPAAVANNNAARPAPGRPPVANTNPDAEDEDSGDDNPPAPAQPVVQQPPQQITPAPMPPDQNAQPNQQNPNQPKTPEQLYQELQNLERQRQQQNPNSPPQPPPPPPQ